MSTRVVHKNKPHDVYIGRPSKWGNPYPLRTESQRAAGIAQYRTWLVLQPHLMAELSELFGKRLGCFCAPRPCHGDVLAELADMPNRDLFY